MGSDSTRSILCKSVLSVFGCRGLAAEAVGQGARREIVERVVAVEETVELVHHQLEEPAAAIFRLTRDVRGQDHVGELEGLAIGGDRLGITDIESGRYEAEK